jgi:hypothetical protein
MRDFRLANVNVIEKKRRDLDVPSGVVDSSPIKLRCRSFFSALSGGTHLDLRLVTSRDSRAGCCMPINVLQLLLSFLPSEYGHDTDINRKRKYISRAQESGRTAGVAEAHKKLPLPPTPKLCV